MSQRRICIIAYKDVRRTIHVLKQIGKSGLVDVRSPKEYSGELLAPENLPQEGAQRGGHIPTAASIPWATAANAEVANAAAANKKPMEKRLMVFM